jgi:hypothetical protein
MKKIILSVIAAAIGYCIAFTQPCLPEGITFTTQEQIDNFQTNYPDCKEIEGGVSIGQGGGDITNLNGLSVLTSIGDYLFIQFNDALTSLSGLENVTSIGNLLWIRYNISLTSLSGLENVTSIGGDLEISGNDVLTNLNGLENFTSIGGDLIIMGNYSLTSLSGLENVTSIGGSLIIQYNDALTSLSGLENVISIGGGLNIMANYPLTSLNGLENVTSIGGGLFIQYNDALTSLSGLENVTSIEGGLNIMGNYSLTSLLGLDNLTSIGGELWITDNNSLSTCEAEWLCSYLSNPSGSINIFGNAEGCSNPPEVAEACGITPFCLPYGNYYFHSQADVDNFQSDYPNCMELEGNVWIKGIDITNLNGLNLVTSIGDILWIEGNNSLTNLMGLNNLTSIGGDLIIYNSALTSLTGLENVTSIGGNLMIGDEESGGNPDLGSLTGLNGLTSIGGDLYIGFNNSLTSLMGLDNIDAGSIADLTIKANSSLSTCDVQSICDYLGSPNGNIYIWSNAPGCMNYLQIKAACLTKLEEIITKNGITIIPNPSNDKITISLPSINRTTQLSIFNVSGEKVIDRQLTDTETQIDISALARGVYFVRLQSEKMVEVGKMVKE